MFSFLMNFQKSRPILYLSTAEIKTGISLILFVDWEQIGVLAVLFFEFFLELLYIYTEPFHLLIFLLLVLALCNVCPGHSPFTLGSKGLPLNTIMAEEYVSPCNCIFSTDLRFLGYGTARAI